MTTTLRDRLEALDWKSIAHSLDERGFARTPPLLTDDECDDLIGMYTDDARFRSRIDMARYRFGLGDYAYFKYPLPPIVREMRTHAYRRLAPIASRWARELRRHERFPPSLRSFTAQCRSQGQQRPTPLLLRYGVEGYNCLHQDLYGGIVFPIQITAFLSRPGVDYEGGEFLLVEQRPRAQSCGTSITANRGELLLFACSDRPTPGKRGTVRVTLRHGVSAITRGERYALGVIFHDAR